MQITETLNEGLKRNISVVVPAKTLEEKLSQRLNDAQAKVNLKGFRPGKAPLSHLRKVYGRSLMAEVIEEVTQEVVRSVLEERKERAAFQPQVDLASSQDALEKVIAGEADFAFSVIYEVLPEIDITPVTTIEITRQISDVPEEEVEAQMKRVLDSARTYQSKEAEATLNDRVQIDYVGKIDGEAFEGGTDQGAHLILGSKTFIPGFEEQLIGAKAGDERDVKVTFPVDYQAAHLAGKEAVFSVKISAVEAPEELVIDDELAKKFGLESMDKLREAIRQQIESHYGSFTRQKVKRQILDALDSCVKFDVPPTLVEEEFKGIWQRVLEEMQQNNQTFEGEGTTEEAQQLEYRRLAERRVRLGLLFAEYARHAGIDVSEQELQAALYSQLRQFPGREQEIYDLYQKDPNMLGALRAPVLEDKVIDDILSKIKVTDHTVSLEELMKMDDVDGSGQVSQPEKKTAKKSATKSADSKKKAKSKTEEKPQDKTSE